MAELKEEKQEKSIEWIKIKPKKGVKRPKARMAFGITSDKNYGYIFGGDCVRTREGNDLWELSFDNVNPNKSTWKLLGVSSNYQPLKRNLCSIHFYDNNIFLFFGRGRKHTLSSIEIFDIKKNEWSKLKIDKCQLCAFTITKYNEYVIIFGGTDHNDKAQNNIWLFDCKKLTLDCLPNIDSNKKDKNNDEGDVEIPLIPDPRKHHVAAIINDFFSMLYVYRIYQL